MDYMYSETDLSIEDWRRNNVNKLVEKIDRTLNRIDSSLWFGISPAGNLEYSRDSIFGDVEKSEAVNKETCDNCKDEFGTDKRKDFSCAFRVGKKNGNCLITCGNENRKHSTGGYDSVGIKVCCNNGKTALGNKSEESADCGTCFSEFSEPCGKFFGMAVFYKFDEQIGSEKERKGRNGMLKGVCENMEKFLHLFYLVYNGFLNNILYFQTHFPSRIFWKKE